MANTQGFEIVAEIGVSVLQEMLKAAWDNGGTDAEGAIPHEVEINPATTIGPYQVQDGQVSISKNGLSLVMAPAQNGITVTMATDIQVNFDQNTLPVPSLSHFDMDADIEVTAPFGNVPGSSINLGVIFEGIPRSSVTVNLTSGDPIGPVTLDLIKEYVHKLYVDGTIPHTITRTDQSYDVFTFDVFLETFDDETNVNHEILVSQPDSSHVTVSIPIHLRLNNFNNPMIQSPMGIEARAIVTALYQKTNDRITCTLSTSTVSVENITPASGTEGTNYNLNLAGAAAMGLNLEDMLKAQISNEVSTFMQSIGDIRIDTPTVAQIETIIGDEVHQELLNRKYFGVWTPETPEGSSVTVDEVRPKALSDALAIAINPQNGANENALINFIPAGQAFGIALDDDYVEQLIGDIVDKPKDDGGFGGIPTTFDNINDYRVDVNELHWDCQSGKIHFWGEVTVHDVICKSDADVSFWADVGLKWVTDPVTGGQVLEPWVIDSDADLPWWAWLLAILTFLFGIILGIIAIVIVAVVEKIVERVGGAVMEDEVSGKLQSLGAWPQQLQGIGTVTSTFQEAVGIASDGLIFSGSILITAEYGLTMVSPANAGGPYFCKARDVIHISGGLPHPKLIREWNLGDGFSGAGDEFDHEYSDNGLYIVRTKSIVTEPGGAATHHSVVVKVQNVIPEVEAGADKEANEGEMIVFTGYFTDKEWVDTHEAFWDFGDDSLPEKGELTETNDPPESSGIITGSHAYCNNGDYTVKLQVRDKDGGVGEDTLTVKVKNLPPVVDAGDLFYAYPCTPVTLVAQFTDPGWCDTHTASWCFGDCTDLFPATVKEIHEPPEGYGIAAATHVYHQCGTFVATCEVTDSDGAKGTDTLAVKVVDVKNKTFEEGYRNLLQGTVANFWEPYTISGSSETTARLSALPASGINFLSEEFVVHSGQRSQHIALKGPYRGGIWQQIGSNPGWDYQVSAWYHLDEKFDGVCRLGIAPDGTTNPDSADILWLEGDIKHEWKRLAGRVTATGDKITIFLEAFSEREETHAYFDDVALVPYPCPLEEPEKEKPEEEKKRCVNWKDEKKARKLGKSYKKDGFEFTSTGGYNANIALWGIPENSGKLILPDSGLKVNLPFLSDYVKATVACHHSDRLIMEAYDAGGNLLGSVSSSQQGQIEILILRFSGIHSLLFKQGGNEAALIELCVGTGDAEEKNNEARKFKRRPLKENMHISRVIKHGINNPKTLKK